MNESGIMQLNTEQQNPNTMHIDECSTVEILEKINHEDQLVPLVLKKQIPQIAKVADQAYEVVSGGGRIFYLGAGTSGRIGILDASECPPTYGVSPDLFQGVIAGGKEAVFTAQEGAEDSFDLAEKDLAERHFSAKDMAVGLAASGRTPYVIGGLKYANAIGAATASVCCVENGDISKIAKLPVELVTGPEVITGSTRMKAGTAQKLFCNMLSTAVMIRCGKVYGNLMVDLQPTNKKLEIRACRMIQEVTDVSEEQARRLYLESHKQVKTAIVMQMKNVSCEEASALLKKANGHIAEALAL